MKPLIFPYTNPFENTFLDILGERPRAFSIISNLIPDTGFKLAEDLYDTVTMPDSSIFNQAFNLYKIYTEGFSHHTGVEDFLSFIDKDNEDSASIVNEIKGGGLTSFDEAFNKSLVLDWFYLLVFDHYEKLKREIYNSFMEIQKKERDIFSMLDGMGPEQDDFRSGINHEISLIPEKFLFLKIKSWMEIFLNSGLENLLWVTDKRCYLEAFDNIFEEGNTELSSGYDLSVMENKPFKAYRSSFTVEEIMGKIFSKEVDKLGKPSIASKHICILVL